VEERVKAQAAQPDDLEIVPPDGFNTEEDALLPEDDDDNEESKI